MRLLSSVSYGIAIDSRASIQVGGALGSFSSIDIGISGYLYLLVVSY